MILLVGLALRLLGLGTESLWFDEAITVSLRRAPLAEMLADPERPPLYYITCLLNLLVLRMECSMLQGREVIDGSGGA